MESAPSPAAPPARGRGILVLEGRGGGRQRRSVAFAERHEVIGVGGDPEESDEEPDEPDEPSEPEPSSLLTPEERQLLSLTQRNTDFNSINSNLSGTSRTMVDWLDDNDRTTERSALTGRHKKFTPLVSIAPFSSGPRSSGGVKVNLVAPMKNGEIITESRNRFEMVEKRTASDPTANKMAEKITRLDDLIDEKPRKVEERSTTSVEITSADSERSRSLATESVSITEFAESARDAASPPPPLVETRLSFSIGGKRETTPAAPEAPTRLADVPRIPAAPAPRRTDKTLEDIPRKDAEEVTRRNSDAVETNGRMRSSLSGVKEDTDEDRPGFRSSSVLPDEASPKKSIGYMTSSDAPSPTRRARAVTSEEVNGTSDTRSAVQNGSPFSMTQREDSMKRTADEPSGTVGSLTTEVLEAVEKAFPRSGGGSVVTLRAGNETSLTSITSDVPDEAQDSVPKRDNMPDSLTYIKSKKSVSSTKMDAELNGDADSTVERKQNGFSPTKEPRSPYNTEENRRSSHSSALQKLIDADVDNQNGYNKKVSALYAQTEKVDEDAVQPENSFTSIKSRFSEKPSEDMLIQNRLKVNKTEAPKPPNTDSIIMLAKDTKENDTQSRDTTFTRASLSKPSPRASFLHSLTNSTPEDEDSSFSDILGSSTISTNDTKPAVNGDDSVIENGKETSEVEAVKTTPPVQRMSAPKANESIIRSSSKPSGGSTRPPILREKPKIAAKPAKLHRLSRATSVESDHGLRSSPEVRRDSVDRDVRNSVEPRTVKDTELEPEQVTKAPEDKKKETEQKDSATGSVCVAVKSPVLDASTRLTKLVESAKPAPEEPKEKSHLTINVSPPRPPVRRESLTRKERTIQRERELEKQREELEKRHREEQDELSEVRPVEARKEHRLAPQPPGHQEVKRTVSVESEAVREHRPAPQPPVHQDLKRTVSNDSEAGREKRPAPEPPVDMALKRTFSNDSETGRGPAPQPPTHLNVKRTISSDSTREHRRAPKPPGDVEPKRPVSKDFENNRTAIANLLSFGQHSSANKRQAPKAPENTSGAEESAESSPQVETKNAGSPSQANDVKPQETSRVWSASPLEDDSSTADSGSCATDATETSGASDHRKRDEDSEQECSQRSSETDADTNHPSLENSQEVYDKYQDSSPQADVRDDEKHVSIPLHKIEENVEENQEQNSSPSSIPSSAHVEAERMPTSKSSAQDEDEDESEQKSSSPVPEAEHIPPITLKVESALPAPAAREQASGKPDEAISQLSEAPPAAESPSSLPARTDTTAKLRIQDDGNPYASTAIFDRRSSFKPDLDDDDDLPPSASMRSSSVSPRSRKRASNAVSFDPGAEYYSRETVMIKPRSQSMPRHVEGLMTDEEVKQKIYGVSPAGVFGASSGGERKSRRDEPKRRGKFSLKKFLKFGSKDDRKSGKEEKKKEKERVAAAERAKPEIIHPLDLTPGGGAVQVIVRSEEEKRKDEAERQRKKALLIAEGTRVYDSPSFSKVRLLQYLNA